jgi:hypothetical protein
MPRVKKTIRPRALRVWFRSDLLAALDLHLFSPLQGRVPHGAYQEFFTPLLQAELERRGAWPPAVDTKTQEK